MKHLTDRIQNLPETPGVYFFFDSGGKLLYVGKSVSVKKRVASYFQSKNLGPKTNQLVAKIAKIRVVKVFSEFEALLLEANYIKKYQPFFNTVAKDDKSPIYIKIAGDPPLVSTTRREKSQKSIFIKGPFPQAKTTREVLRMIRKIFPYCHHKNPQKPCLYVHLGLCPYPYGDKQAKTTYLNSITKVKKLLSGNSKSLIRDLTGEMKTLSNMQKYEEADEVKKQIEKIQYITSTYHTPEEFLAQPTLVDDQIAQRLNQLQTILELEKMPRRIECYDISNISGKFATGAMVVFSGGQPDKSQYRRFRIKFTHKPNDYEMIREVLARRLKNDWHKPDLVIIDGGRGQLNSALSVINKFKKSIRVISLAKRFEEIYTPDKILPISLPKESPARQLAQQIRDEAHRFAVTYHRLLRSKRLFSLTAKIN